jgi:SAM-dependent methyltransferase
MNKLVNIVSATEEDMHMSDSHKLVNQYLRQLLSIHWLRPENALWRTFDCLLMHPYSFGGKTADLGCGDGTLSYVMAGGRLPSYDAYAQVTSVKGYREGADIYNMTVEEDDVLTLDSSAVRYTYSFGIDHKEGLISKARRFQGFYDRTIVHDLNKPLLLEEGGLSAAFSNVLYWLDDVDATLADWARIIKRSGKLFLFVPNKCFKEKAWLYYLAPHADDKRYYNFLDRGYNALIKHCYTNKEWEALFSRSGFHVVQHKKYLTDPVMELWNIGTRPIAPLLINMASNLRPQKKDEMRQEWVDYFTSFFTPIIEEEFGRNPSDRAYAFHFYVLEKKA